MFVFEQLSLLLTDLVSLTGEKLVMILRSELIMP